MSDKELTIDEKIRLARAPITVGILGELRERAATVQPIAHAGAGRRPHTSVYNDQGYRVGNQALRLGSGEGVF